MLFERQQYQQDCVDNIIRVLAHVDFKGDNAEALAANRQTLKANLQELAEQNPKHKQYGAPKGENRLDVLMETGTGKTFTYLQTILELNKRYGLTKFIIVLPRTAIKQGVIQNIKLTDEYFFNLYGKHINYIDYPRDGLNKIKNNFINSDALSVLITTNSAFNSERNNINKLQETLIDHGSTWGGIAAQKPVVIIDEPHLLKGSETAKGLAKLANSLFIRFGATFPKEEEHKLSNIVYMLDSISAFNQYLVKRIGVTTVYSDDQEGSVAVANIKAKQSFDLCFSRDGQPHRVTLRKGEDIGAKSGIRDYAGVFATRISAQKISLSNRKEILAKSDYVLSDEEIRFMVRRAIKHHFEKEYDLFQKGIKALTLMFIPNVADFRGDNPRIKGIFEEEYKSVRAAFYGSTEDVDYRAYLDMDYNNSGQLCVHEGYFSGDGKNEDERIKEGVDIILNDKEKLLSLDTPLRFVFSVWALQEGWDNPNIFTICKLAASHQETSRRQQVGRGLRLAVNQKGKRLTEGYMKNDEDAFYKVNTLDMVVSGEEQTFIHQIQNEINDASYAYVGDKLTLDVMKNKGLNDMEAALIFSALVHGGILSGEGEIKSIIVDFLRKNRDHFSGVIDDARFEEICAIFAASHRPVVRDNNKKKTMINIKPDKWVEFKALWEAINRKAKIVYREIKEKELIEEISEQFNAQTIAQLKPRVEREILHTQKGRVETVSDEQLEYQNRQPFDMGKFALEVARDEKLPLRFVCGLFSKLNEESFSNDVAKARKILLHLIKENVHASILQCIKYEFVETNIYPNSLQKANGDSRGQIPSTELGMMLLDGAPPDHFLYDKAAYDSAIERESIEGDAPLIDNHAIKVFAKLPKINIPTPYKTYNPDFAYLIETSKGKTLFLVVETKGYDVETEIPQDERQKISYGRKFFEQLNKELPNIEVSYQTRINKGELRQVIEAAIAGK